MVVDGTKRLKSSQHYPPAFGAAVAALYAKHRGSFKATAKQIRLLQYTKTAKPDLDHMLHAPLDARERAMLRGAQLEGVFEPASAASAG